MLHLLHGGHVVVPHGDGDEFVNLAADDLLEVVVEAIDFLAHQQVVAVFLLVGDEAFQDEAGGTLGADALGEADAAAQGTVDEHAEGLVGGGGHVVQDFHQYAHTPHQQGGQDEDDGGHGVGEDFAVFVARGGEQHVGGDGQYEGQSVAAGHAHEVHERGVAQDAGVGVEEPEADEAEQDVGQQGVEHADAMCEQFAGTVEYPIDDYARHE